MVTDETVSFETAAYHDPPPQHVTSILRAYCLDLASCRYIFLFLLKLTIAAENG